MKLDFTLFRGSLLLSIVSCLIGFLFRRKSESLPIFFYNTLDLIAFLCYRSEQIKACEVIKIGYTHYWNLKVDTKVKSLIPILSEIKKVLEPYKKILQYDYKNGKPIVITQTMIRFNGIGDDGHETFCFKLGDEEFRDGFSFSFCKTARKPYDIAVCKVLLLLKSLFKDDLKISSDGFVSDDSGFDSSWNQSFEDLIEKGYSIDYTVSHTDGQLFYDCQLISVNPPH